MCCRSVILTTPSKQDSRATRLLLDRHPPHRLNSRIPPLPPAPKLPRITLLRPRPAQLLLRRQRRRHLHTSTSNNTMHRLNSNSTRRLLNNNMPLPRSNNMPHHHKRLLHLCNTAHCPSICGLPRPHRKARRTSRSLPPLRHTPRRTTRGRTRRRRHSICSRHTRRRKSRPRLIPQRLIPLAPPLAITSLVLPQR